MNLSTNRFPTIAGTFALARRVKRTVVPSSAHKALSSASSATALKSVPAASKSQVSSPRKEKIGVVIVDDEADMRLMLQQLLEGSGEFGCVGSYATAAECIAEIPKVSPDVVLMDIRMPGMSGVECTRQLKKMMPAINVLTTRS